ncbi:SpoIIE family protein phosphatase [Oryzihumus sp.]
MPPALLRVHRTFAAEARSVVEARRFAREQLEQWGATDVLDSVSLVVSELVTNAVVHTGTPARVALQLQGSDLRVEVEDHHPGRAVPLVPERPVDRAEHGRGLLITASLSSAWGVEYSPTTKRVWATCPLPGGDRSLPHPAAAEPAGTARVGVVETAPDGRVTHWNEDACAMSGWLSSDVTGRPAADLLDPEPGQGLPADLADPTFAARWQGTCQLTCRDGSTVDVYATSVRRTAGGQVVLFVPSGQREVVAPPVGATARPAAPPSPVLPGLRPEALVRLGSQELLALAVEHVRDPVQADATWLLLVHEVDDDMEVAAVSGLPEAVLGTRLAPGSPGAPSAQSPERPVVFTDTADHPVSLLAGTDLRSLVVVPLLVEGRVVGALGAASARVDGFTDDQAVLLQRFADSIAVAADRARLQASERARREWLTFIADAGDLLAASLDHDMTMAITGQIVVPRIAPWCAIHLLDQRGVPVLQQVWHQDETRVDALREEFAQPPAAAATTDGGDEGALWPQVQGQPVTTIPLVARRRRIGYLTLGRPPEELRRTEFYLVAESIARRAALAIDNARAHGNLQAVGRALQESLLPPSTPSPPGLDVGVVYEAAGEDTLAGGDFYDLFPAGNGRWCFVVGDVCGTGAEAAAVTGLARHTVQALVRAGFPLPATLERLNTAILEEGERSRFLTLVCGTLHVEGGRMRLTLVNAGHPPVFLVGPEGQVREVGNPQPLLGVVEAVAYTAEEHVLQRDDLLVALTDGVTERRDGDVMLGAEGVARELASTSGMPAQAVAEQVRRLAVDYSAAPQRDDMAILAIRVQVGPVVAQGPA